MRDGLERGEVPAHDAELARGARCAVGRGGEVAAAVEEGELAGLVVEPAVGGGGGAVDAEDAAEVLVLAVEPRNLVLALDRPVLAGCEEAVELFGRGDRGGGGGGEEGGVMCLGRVGRGRGFGVVWELAVHGSYERAEIVGESV